VEQPLPLVRSSLTSMLYSGTLIRNYIQNNSHTHTHTHTYINIVACCLCCVTNNFTWVLDLANIYWMLTFTHSSTIIIPL
jgi:hypothetical protein